MISWLLSVSGFQFSGFIQPSDCLIQWSNNDPIWFDDEIKMKNGFISFPIKTEDVFLLTLRSDVKLINSIFLWMRIVQSPMWPIFFTSRFEVSATLSTKNRFACWWKGGERTSFITTTIHLLKIRFADKIWWSLYCYKYMNH